jgi:hypothetical protein
MQNITAEFTILPIVSETPNEIIVPIGTKSSPKGISNTTSEIVAFMNYKDTRVWYVAKKDLQKYISKNTDKLKFFLDEEQYNTMCIKLTHADMAHFNQAIRR